MWDKIVLNMVIGFVLRQLAKFGEKVDWEKVKADADARVRQLVPGTWFDDEAAAVVDSLVDACKIAVSSSDDWGRILHAVGAQDWEGALAALKDLLLKVWHPAAVGAGLGEAVATQRILALLPFHPADRLDVA